MVTSDVTKYKNVIMEKLYSTPDIVTLLHNSDISPNSPVELINKNLFSYIKIPNSTLQAKNYICFDFNARSSSYNDLYKNVTIKFAIICHESELNCGWGNRHDVLGGVLIETFNWSNILGLQLELVSDTESVFENEYHARTLQFQNLTLNSIKNGAKINGIR